MMLIALDSNVIVAACSSWHPHHSTCMEALAPVDTQDLVISVHALAESFSVLTRLPVPRRYAPAMAWRLLDERFYSVSQIAGVEGRDLSQAVAACRVAGTAGGRVYDALIAYCAARAGATVIWTLNPKHFLAIAPPNVAIATPGSSLH